MISSPVRRITVLRGGGLGDLVFALPALEALRARYPDVQVTLAGEGWQREVLEGRRAVAGGPLLVDWFVALAPGSVRLLRTGEDDEHATGAAQLAALRADAPDVAVQLHGGGRWSNPFTVALGARWTVGLRTPDAPPLHRWVPYLHYQSEVMRALEVVGLLDAPAVSIEPRLHVPPAPRSAARSVLADAGVAADTRFAVIHPAASDPRRRWTPEGFASVARGLAAAGIRPVVVGNEAERPLGREVAAQGGGEALDLTGVIDLATLTGLLAEAALVVGNDSGPVHLGRAAGAPTVAVYWCGNLVNAGPAFRARHRPVISWRLDCPVCGVDCTRARCPHDASFVADVPVDEVVEAALDLAAG